MVNNPTEPNLLNIEEVASQLRMNKETVRKLVKNGKLPAIDLPNGLHFKHIWIDMYLEENTINPELIAGGRE